MDDDFIFNIDEEDEAGEDLLAALHYDWRWRERNALKPGHCLCCGEFKDKDYESLWGCCPYCGKIED